MFFWIHILFILVLQIVVKNIFAECQALGEPKLRRVPADLALGKELSKFFLILCRVLDRLALGKADPALGKERIHRLMHAAPCDRTAQIKPA